MNIKRLTNVSMLAILLLGKAHCTVETDSSRIAGAFFQQFETVFHAKTSLLLRAEPNTFPRTPFTLLFKSLSLLGPTASEDILRNTEEIVTGTKDYAMPRGLGVVRSTFCYALVMRERSELDLNSYFTSPPILSAGTPVWSWSSPLEEFGEDDPRPSTLYMAQLAPSYVLISNHFEELEHTIAQLKGSPEKSLPSPIGIREWGEIRQHDFWGYRRYRHKEPQDSLAAGTRRVTPAMEALVIYANAGENRGTLRLLEAIPDQVKESSAFKIMPTFTRLGSGWQAVVPLEYQDEDQAGMKGVFLLSWLFGLGPIV